MTVADLKRDQPNSMGDMVVVIYGFKPPEYAVYGTETRILVQFADDVQSESKQRKAMVPLNPVRGEINGLINGWRLHKYRNLRRKASRYDRRVGDALVVALEEDIESAASLLRVIKQDIIDERTAWARFEYLSAAFILSLICIGLAVIFARDVLAGDLWLAAAAGSIGAFFSISLAIRGRTVLTDLQRTSNIMDASLRIIIGFIAASVLIALVTSQVVTVGLGDAKLGLPADKPWLFVLIIGFIAGFSERFVPDLLAKATASTQTPPSPSMQLPSQKPIAAGGVGSSSSDTPPELKNEDKEVKDDPLQQEEEVDHCLCGLDVSDTEATLDTELPATAGGVVTTQGERKQ